MWKWRRNREGRPDDARLALEQRVQELRLELAERDRALAELRRKADQLEHGERDRQAQALRAQMERLVAASATRITQLNTQAHLIDAEGKPVTAWDVVANARGLLRVFEDEGVTLEGRPGEVVPFDASRHELLQAGAGCADGEPVEVRLCGVYFRGRLLRKAGVTRREARP
jgi:molecular chaperone GrpE (heat shock protein)